MAPALCLWCALRARTMLALTHRSWLLLYQCTARVGGASRRRDAPPPPAPLPSSLPSCRLAASCRAHVHCISFPVFVSLARRVLRLFVAGPPAIATRIRCALRHRPLALPSLARSRSPLACPRPPAARRRGRRPLPVPAWPPPLRSVRLHRTDEAPLRPKRASAVRRRDVTWCAPRRRRSSSAG